MTQPPDILCIGSVLWDVIGRSPAAMRVGSDVPGRIVRAPGGVALNIATALRHFGLRPALLSALGRDARGRALADRCRQLGLITEYLHVSEDLPTDSYMAVEGANGLIAAIADAHSLEAVGNKILQPLADGRLGSASARWSGPIVIDGNLTETLLAEIAESPLFAAAALYVAPASPGKAERLLPLLGHQGATFYVNLEEAALLTATRPTDASEAAATMRHRGASRVLVTDGARPAAYAGQGGDVTATPPPVLVTRVTGAGDALMAAHIAADLAGAAPEVALSQALESAARHISGDV